MTNQHNSSTSFLQGAVAASMVWSCGCYFHNYYYYKVNTDYYSRNEVVIRDSNKGNNDTTSRQRSDNQMEEQEGESSNPKNNTTNEHNEKVVQTLSRIVSNRTMVVSETVRKRMRWPWETLRNKLSKPKLHDKEKNNDNDENKNPTEETLQQNKSPVNKDEPSTGFNKNTATLDSSFPTLHDGDEEEHNDEKKSVCIGSIFGLDAGGTLSKLVYFEENSLNDNQYNTKGSHYNRKESSSKHSSLKMNKNYPLNFSDIKQGKRGSLPGQFQSDGEIIDEHVSQMQQQQQQHNAHHLIKSTSMFDFSAQRAEALDRFFNFIRKLDTYYEQQENGDDSNKNKNKNRRSSTSKTKECNLSFYSRTVGGTFHFMNFETRHMHKAMELVYTHKLHLNIHKMGATGGGAHKYAKDWKRRLDIQMDKQDELDSLVVGMQFILLDVIGECYTFQPYQTDDYFSNDSPTKPQPQSFESNDNDIIPSQRSVDRSSSIGLDLSNTSLQKIDESETDAFSEDLEKTASRETILKIDKIEHENSKGNHLLKEKMEENSNNNNIAANNDNSNQGNSEKKFDIRSWARKVKRDVAGDNDLYPYMVVIIGTGVSLLRVDGPRKYERVSGSTIGGGTYWGLCRLLTDVETFEDVMKLAEQGDPSKVDM
jgi:hypothetical protein